MSENGVGVLDLPLLAASGVGAETIPGTGAVVLLLLSTAGIGATNSLSDGTGVLSLPLLATAGVGAETMPGAGALIVLPAGEGGKHFLECSGAGVETIPGTGVLVVLPSGIAGHFLQCAGWGWTIATFGGGPGGAGVLDLNSVFGNVETDLRETSILMLPLWGGSSGTTGSGIDLSIPATEYVPDHLIRGIKCDGGGDLCYTTLDGNFHKIVVADGEMITGELIISINTTAHATPTTATGVHIFF